MNGSVNHTLSTYFVEVRHFKLYKIFHNKYLEKNRETLLNQCFTVFIIPTRLSVFYQAIIN